MTLLSKHTELNLGIRASDLAPKDKMNFAAVERLCSPKVISIVAQTDPALSLYLKLIQYSVFSFVNSTLSLQQRIKQMAYAAHLVRTWKKINPTTTITPNQVICIFLNFTNLVGLVSFFHQYYPTTPLYPEMFGSQENEGYFRKLRFVKED